MVNKGLISGFTGAHSETPHTFLGDNSKVLFRPEVEVNAVAKVESWVSTEWVERALKDPNDGSPGANQYTFVNPPNDTITVKYGTAPVAPIAQVNTITCDSKENHGVADFFIAYAKDSTAYGVWIKKEETDVEPTAPAWQALETANKAVADIEGDTTNEQVAATVRAALSGIEDIGEKITVGSVSTATFPLTQVEEGDCLNPLRSNADGTGNGAFTVATTTIGITNTARITFVQGSNTMVRYLNSGMGKNAIP